MILFPCSISRSQTQIAVFKKQAQIISPDKSSYSWTGSRCRIGFLRLPKLVSRGCQKAGRPPLVMLRACVGGGWRINVRPCRPG